MATNVKLRIQPFYGWGWHDLNASIDVPSSFDLTVSIVESGSPFKVAVGQVEKTSHPLSELWILLTQRHVTNDGDYNLCAFQEEPLPNKNSKPCITGFASAVIISACCTLLTP